MTQTIRSAWSNVASATTPGGPPPACPGPAWFTSVFTSAGTDLGGRTKNLTPATLGSADTDLGGRIDSRYAGQPYRVREYYYRDADVETLVVSDGVIDGSGVLPGYGDHAGYEAVSAGSDTPGWYHHTRGVVRVEVACGGVWPAPYVPGVTDDSSCSAVL